MSDKIECSVRKATFGDAEGLFTLWRQHMQFHNLLEPNIDNETKNDWKRWFEFVLDNQNYKIYVAEQQDNLIGYVIGVVKIVHPALRKRYGEISEIFVIEEKRGKGVTKLLLKDLSTWFLNKNIKLIEVRASPTNHKENEMWESLGFKLNWLLLIIDIEKVQ